MAKLFARINALFVLWVVAFSVLAYAIPGAFTWFRPYIARGLGCIMLGMGLTLVPADFVRVWQHRGAVGIGVLGQYGMMPLGGFLVARALGLPPALAAGLILVTVCPGGTASNVIAYLAGADVALSVSMTTVSTLLSPLMTPLLLRLYAGELVEVSFAAQALTIVKIIVVPVLVGLGARVLLDRRGRHGTVESLLHVFPTISIAFIVLIVACIVGLNRDRLGAFGWQVVLGVIVTNAFGLLAGYGLARLFRADVRTARTIAIEVGMQNSGLGVALAGSFFTPVTALPSAFFSLWHNITGPALAAYWAAHPGPPAAPSSAPPAD